MSQTPGNTLRRKKKVAPAPPVGSNGSMGQKMSFLYSNSSSNNDNNGEMISEYSHNPADENVSIIAYLKIYWSLDLLDFEG